MARKGSAKAAKQPAAASVKISLDYTNSEPLYANFAEISSAQHEFQIAFALVPARPTTDQIRDGAVKLNPLVQIMLPPTLIPGLIKALITTKEQYEALLGPIKEFGA
jgi:hypothetical protein